MLQTSPLRARRAASALLCATLLAAPLAGCKDPEWANKAAMQIGAPRANAVEMRELQTATFHGVDERALLIETTQALQDLGFTIEESTAKYGVLAGSKDRDAVETGEVAGQIALTVGLALLGVRYNPTWDTDQVIRATVTTAPYEGDSTRMRVSFERIVTRNDGNSRAEELNAPEFTSGFFDKVRSGLHRSE
ncbi:hypothetical protein ACQ5SO_03555 [Rhodovulum sp. DZ06]|uniref:hypothetical protein n=1 Tax=Rhodovulum sp. DZ06 TaxID=3425126 RepID=UPI003D34E834